MSWREILYLSQWYTLAQTMYGYKEKHKGKVTVWYNPNWCTMILEIFLLAVQGAKFNDSILFNLIFASVYLNAGALTG